MQRVEADDGHGDHDARVRWMAPPKLPRFSGELADGPVEDFIDEAERVLDAYKLQGHLGCEYVLRHLDGTARREALAGRHANPADLLAALHIAFGDARSVMALLSAFHGRRQRADESLLHYVHAVQDLAARVNAKQADTLGVKAVRDRFVEGLFCSSLQRELRRLVRSNGEITLATLRAEATEWLRHDQAETVVQRQRPSFEPESSKLDKLTEQVTALTAGLQAMQAAVLSLSERASANPVAPPQPRERKCFKCNQVGHFVRNCPEAKKSGN